MTLKVIASSIQIWVLAAYRFSLAQTQTQTQTSILSGENGCENPQIWVFQVQFCREEGEATLHKRWLFPNRNPDA